MIPTVKPEKRFRFLSYLELFDSPPVISGDYAMGSGHAFLFFSLAMFIQAIVVWKYFPETKGKTLEELGIELSGNPNSSVG